MEAHQKPLVFEPLGTSEIRLVRFTKDSKTPDRVQLQLERFQMENVPSFVALSYAWGDSKDSHAVSVNNRSFSVTKSLFLALTHIYDLLPYFEEGIREASNTSQDELFLWIDAICINQENMDEKSQQIPKMTEIYSSAYTVLIWLGVIDEHTLDIFNFKSLLDAFHQASPLVGFPRPPLSIEACQENCSNWDVMMAYAKLLQNDWFERVWVIQEYSLSRRDPYVLLGHSLFPFRSLCDPYQLVDFTEESMMSHMVAEYAENKFGKTYMRDWVTSTEFQKQSLANQLLWLMMNFGQKRSTVAHDQIYGFLGMVGLAQLPEKLMPDYRKPYAEVCKDYTVFIIENTKDLSLLASIKSDDSELRWSNPSWVVDFQSHFAARNAQPAVLHNGFFSTDGQRLVVEAVKTSKIISYFSGTKDEAGESLRQFHDTLLTAAARVRQEHPTTTWKRWVSNFLKSRGLLVPKCEDLETRYQSVWDFLSTHAAGDYRGIADGFGTDVFLKYFGRCEFVLMDDGEIAKCHRHQRHQRLGLEGEQYVFAFKGSTQRSIVYRERGDTYRYLDWLWEPDFILDEDFFANHVVEQITLI